MAKRRAATDGISKNPSHASQSLVKYTDWEQLRRAFMIQEVYTMVGPWLQEVMGWNLNRIRSGHTRKMVDGWGKQRAKLQAKKTELAIKQALEVERQAIPELRRAKAELIKGIMKDVKRWDRLNTMDKKLCYEILKVELREPTNVKDLPAATAKDPIEALLEEFGLMEDGEIIDDDPTEDSRLISRGDSAEAAEADSSTPAEVSQA